MDGSDSRSLMKLHSSGQPGLEKASSKLAHVVVGRLQFLTGRWLETSVSCHISLSIGSLNAFMMCQLASPRVTDDREKETKQKFQSLMI